MRGGSSVCCHRRAKPATFACRIRPGRRWHKERLRPLAFTKNPFASTVLETDAYVAWLGAHQGGDGAIVILGTGSCRLTMIKGRRIGVAGWGAEVRMRRAVKEWVGKALHRTLWTLDGRAEKTALSAAILDRFGGDRLKSSVLHQERHLLFMLSCATGPPICVGARSPSCHARAGNGGGCGRYH